MPSTSSQQPQQPPHNGPLFYRGKNASRIPFKRGACVKLQKPTRTEAGNDTTTMLQGNTASSAASNYIISKLDCNHKIKNRVDNMLAITVQTPFGFTLQKHWPLIALDDPPVTVMQLLQQFKVPVNYALQAPVLLPREFTQYGSYLMKDDLLYPVLNHLYTRILKEEENGKHVFQEALMQKQLYKQYCYKPHPTLTVVNHTFKFTLVPTTPEHKMLKILTMTGEPFSFVPLTHPTNLFPETLDEFREQILRNQIAFAKAIPEQTSCEEEDGGISAGFCNYIGTASSSSCSSTTFCSGSAIGAKVDAHPGFSSVLTAGRSFDDASSSSWDAGTTGGASRGEDGPCRSGQHPPGVFLCEMNDYNRCPTSSPPPVKLMNQRLLTAKDFNSLVGTARIVYGGAASSSGATSSSDRPDVEKANNAGSTSYLDTLLNQNTNLWTPMDYKMFVTQMTKKLAEVDESFFEESLTASVSSGVIGASGETSTGSSEQGPVYAQMLDVVEESSSATSSDDSDSDSDDYPAELDLDVDAPTTATTTMTRGAFLRQRLVQTRVGGSILPTSSAAVSRQCPLQLSLVRSAPSLEQVVMKMQKMMINAIFTPQRTSEETQISQVDSDAVADEHSTRNRLKAAVHILHRQARRLVLKADRSLPRGRATMSRGAPTSSAAATSTTADEVKLLRNGRVQDSRLVYFQGTMMSSGTLTPRTAAGRELIEHLGGGGPGVQQQQIITGMNHLIDAPGEQDHGINAMYNREQQQSIPVLQLQQMQMTPSVYYQKLQEWRITKKSISLISAAIWNSVRARPEVTEVLLKNDLLQAAADRISQQESSNGEVKTVSFDGKSMTIVEKTTNVKIYKTFIDPAVDFEFGAAEFFQTEIPTAASSLRQEVPDNMLNHAQPSTSGSSSDYSSSSSVPAASAGFPPAESSELQAESKKSFLKLPHFEFETTFIAGSSGEDAHYFHIRSHNKFHFEFAFDYYTGNLKRMDFRVYHLLERRVKVETKTVKIDRKEEGDVEMSVNRDDSRRSDTIPTVGTAQLDGGNKQGAEVDYYTHAAAGAASSSTRTKAAGGGTTSSQQEEQMHYYLHSDGLSTPHVPFMSSSDSSGGPPSPTPALEVEHQYAPDTSVSVPSRVAPLPCRSAATMPAVTFIEDCAGNLSLGVVEQGQHDVDRQQEQLQLPASAASTSQFLTTTTSSLAAPSRSTTDLTNWPTGGHQPRQRDSTAPSPPPSDSIQKAENKEKMTSPPRVEFRTERSLLRTWARVELNEEEYYSNETQVRLEVITCQPKEVRHMMVPQSVLSRQEY
ncbi:unnamed protein product [Amoebophrya sp. A120]|nr:unnamed protein product [Amoebophrya sp. A120]|eukprot:GSA120T00013425001.1